MIGLNGSLVAILCIAYFVLIACALAFGRAAADGDQAMVRSENELARRRRQHAFAATREDSALPAVVTYARTTSDDEADGASGRADDRRNGAELATVPAELLGRAADGSLRASSPTGEPTERSDVRQKKKWSELSPAARTAIVIGAERRAHPHDDRAA